MGEELIRSPDWDTLYRRAVEMPRERLGLDRTGLFLVDGTVVRGTFGTDSKGQTVDERGVVLAMDEFWQVYFRVRLPNDARWSIRVEDHIEFQGTQRVVFSEGWVAATPVIRAASRHAPAQPRALFFNDMAISGTPFDQDMQEVIAVYCSLIGEIMERRTVDELSRNLEARMLEAQRMESLIRMAGGVAHDFNNLLAAIIGNAELAMLDVHPGADGAPIRESLGEILSAASRAAALSREMLAFSGCTISAFNSVAINASIAQSLEHIRASVPAPVRLSFEPCDGEPLVNGDDNQIRQAVRNLVLNAIEAIGEGRGAVTVRTSIVVGSAAAERDPALNGPGPYLAVEIFDTGCGMTPEVRQKAFDPFFSTKFAGRGLGLAAVRGIVQRHEGGMHVASEPGRGSSFTMFLPIAQVATGPRTTVHGAARDPGERQITVLAVDDEPGVLDVLRRILEREGMNVRTAANGVEAVAAIDRSTHPPDLVILDVTMPQMDGYDTLRELRNRHPGLRVLLASGHAAQEVVVRLQEGEQAEFIQKPYVREALLEKIRVMLAVTNRG
jgi:signal transduction histidine kinase/CheY-like chemotaxis protein